MQSREMSLVNFHPAPSFSQEIRKGIQASWASLAANNTSKDSYPNHRSSSPSKHGHTTRHAIQSRRPAHLLHHGLHLTGASVSRV